MALISLPGDSRVKLPGLGADPNPHISLVYLGDDVDALDLIKVIKLVSNICSNTFKFMVKTEYSSVFSKGKYGYPIIAPIESVDVCVLRDKILQGLMVNKLPYVNNFMTFRPHQTICFKDKIIPSQPLKVSWVVDKVNVWPEDKGTRGEINIPLFTNFTV